MRYSKKANLANTDSRKLDKTLRYFPKQSSSCHTFNVTRWRVSPTGVLFPSPLYEAEKQEHGDKTGETLNIIARWIVHVTPLWPTLNEMLLFITAKQREARLQHHLPLSLTTVKPLALRHHSLLLSAAVRRSHVVHLSSTLLWTQHNHNRPPPTSRTAGASAIPKEFQLNLFRIIKRGGGGGQVRQTAAMQIQLIRKISITAAINS